MSKKSPKPNGTATEIVARYGAFYHGDDDEFAHCFLRRDGRCVLLFQGLSTVFATEFHAQRDDFKRLVELLAEGIPAGWAKATYDGYNFVTDPDGPNASEIAVYGIQSGDSTGLGRYYAAPPDSPIGDLVKAIAKID